MSSGTSHQGASQPTTDVHCASKDRGTKPSAEVAPKERKVSHYNTYDLTWLQGNMFMKANDLTKKTVKST